MSYFIDLISTHTQTLYVTLRIAFGSFQKLGSYGGRQRGKERRGCIYDAGTSLGCKEGRQTAEEVLLFQLYIAAYT